MASVHLLSAARGGPGHDPKAHLDLEQMRTAAAADRFGEHSVVDDPEAADVVLFVETSVAAGPYFEAVRRSRVYREQRLKSYLFSSTDRIVPFLPGVYASVERRWFWPSWTRPGFYLGVREREGLRHEPGSRPRLLYSFVGDAAASPVRAAIMRLEHPDGVVADTGEGSGERGPVPPDAYLERFASSIAESAFVLCPRGRGAATFRLFETMMLGRVPVVLSDAWVPPQGPDWESFSIRVAERDVERVPSLLEGRAGEAGAMGEAARAAWLAWFSEQASFHRTVDWCLDLGRRSRAREGIRRYAPFAQMLRPYHAARAVAKRLGHGDGGATHPR